MNSPDAYGCAFYVVHPELSNLFEMFGATPDEARIAEITEGRIEPLAAV